MIGTTKHRVTALGLLLSLTACGGGGDGNDAGNGGAQPPVVSTNQAPVISGLPTDTVEAGNPYSFTPTASDPDGDPLTFALQNAPIWMLVDDATGEISGIPTSSNIGSNDDIRLTVSDGRASVSLDPFSVAVMPEKVGREDFIPGGVTFPTDNGYQAIGELTMITGELEQQFQNADVVLEFDEEGNLVDLFGETDLPESISRNVAINTGVRAVVGFMKGAEINADEDFGIRLMEDSNYFVYYIGTSFDITVGNRDNPNITSVVTIEPPLSTQTIMISDPTDSFLYQFAGTPAGDYGSGESDNGLIPFVPDLLYAPLDTFNGYTIQKGAIGLGIKAVDLFEVSGTMVIKDPQFADIDLDDVFNSPVEFRAGLNGALDFALSIAGFGLFSFDIAETSATLDVGFDRQALAMSLEIEPEQPLFPLSYALDLHSRATGTGFVNGDGEYGFELTGNWTTELPDSSLGGVVSIENGTVTLEGSTSGGNGAPLVARLEFSNDETVGTVQFPESYSAGINGFVSAELDERLNEVDEAIQEVESAIADLEFEVSLRGIRENLPALADTAVQRLNAIPEDARSAARSGTLSYLKNTCRTFGVGLASVRTCLADVVDENDIANDAGNDAYSVANNAIRSPKAAMLEMKKRALEADDETLRQALKDALTEAYNNRSLRYSVEVERRIGAPFDATYTLYSVNTEKTVLNNTEANLVLQGRDNVDNIGPADTYRVETQQILDRLPTREVLDEIKQQVDSNTADMPTVGELGYRAVSDQYSAFATIDGDRIETDINVLSPSEVREGVVDLLTDILISETGQD